jgi:hypothetical protein
VTVPPEAAKVAIFKYCPWLTIDSSKKILSVKIRYIAKGLIQKANTDGKNAGAKIERGKANGIGINRLALLVCHKTRYFSRKEPF